MSGGCCWRPVSQQQTVIGTSRAPAPEGNGVIALTEHPEASQPYTGEHRRETIYIVGWGTEHERLFLASEAKAAVAYRNGTDRDLRLDNVFAGQLAPEAIEALYSDS